MTPLSFVPVMSHLPTSPHRSPLVDALQTHYHSLLMAAARVLRSRDCAADVVQDAYLKVVAMGDTGSVANPLAFLHRMTRNLSIDLLREREVRERHVDSGQLPEQVADASPGGERRVMGQQRLALLASIVDELPPRCREVFLLRKVDLLHPDDIAGHLGISRNMVEKHLRKALVHCQARLEELER